MLLLAVLVATASWSSGFAQEIPIQSPISITKFRKSARMTCEIHTSGTNFDDIVIHWYQQKEGEAPVRLLFYVRGRATVDSGFQANRYMVDRISTQKRCVLTIRDVIPDDAATYYCAYWDPHCDRNSKIIKAKKTPATSEPQGCNCATPPAFSLHLSELLKGQTFSCYSKKAAKGSSQPANSEILQKKHENQIMYVCLIEKFYPEVIRVTWTDEEKEITDNVVKGDTWQPTKEDDYSIASWLTVPAENKDKKYYCKYEHESQSYSLPTQDSMKTVDSKKTADSVQTAPQEKNCTAVFSTDHLMHRTAYLVYIILLLKSSMYYLIILFFIYRMWSSTKHRGKKA